MAQTTNPISHNVLQINAEMVPLLMDQLDSAIPFDLYLEILRMYVELIQGPNKLTQRILIEEEFIEQDSVILSYFREKVSESQIAKKRLRKFSDSFSGVSA